MEQLNNIWARASSHWQKTRCVRVGGCWNLWYPQLCDSSRFTVQSTFALVLGVDYRQQHSLTHELRDAPCASVLRPSLLLTNWFNWRTWWPCLSRTGLSHGRCGSYERMAESWCGDTHLSHRISMTYVYCILRFTTTVLVLLVAPATFEQYLVLVASSTIDHAFECSSTVYLWHIVLVVGVLAIGQAMQPCIKVTVQVTCTRTRYVIAHSSYVIVPGAVLLRKFCTFFDAEEIASTVGLGVWHTLYSCREQQSRERYGRCYSRMLYGVLLLYNHDWTTVRKSGRRLSFTSAMTYPRGSFCVAENDSCKAFGGIGDTCMLEDLSALTQLIQSIHRYKCCTWSSLLGLQL